MNKLLLSMILLNITFMTSLASSDSLVKKPVTSVLVETKKIETEAGTTCADCAVKTASPSLVFKKPLAKVLAEPAKLKSKLRLVDATFYWDIKSDEAAQDVSAISAASGLNINAAEASQVSLLYQEAFNAAGFKEMLSLLGKKKKA